MFAVAFACCFVCVCRSPGTHHRREIEDERQICCPMYCSPRWRVVPRAASDGGAWENAPPVPSASATVPETVPELLFVIFFVFMCLFEFLLYFELLFVKYIMEKEKTCV